MNLGINDQPYHLEAGELVLFGGGDVHYIIASPDSERWVYQFDPKIFANLQRLNSDFDVQQLFGKLQPISPQWSPQLKTAVKDSLAKLRLAATRPTKTAYFVMERELCNLVDLASTQWPYKNQPTHPRVKIRQQAILQQLDTIFRYVEQHYQMAIPLAEVAQASGFSVYYFTRFFKRNTGKTFVTFLNEYRVDKAKWRLIYSDDPVLTIINQVGFTSDKTFYRVFKKVVGITPKEYRLAYRQTAK